MFKRKKEKGPKRSALLQVDTCIFVSTCMYKLVALVFDKPIRRPLHTEQGKPNLTSKDMELYSTRIPSFSCIPKWCVRVLTLNHLAILEIIAWHQTSSTLNTNNLRLPPPVFLFVQNGQYIALRKR